MRVRIVSMMLVLSACTQGATTEPDPITPPVTVSVVAPTRSVPGTTTTKVPDAVELFRPDVSLHPSLSSSDITSLLDSVGSLPTIDEMLGAFAREELGMEDFTLEIAQGSTDQTSWIVVTPDLEVQASAVVLGYRADRTPLWGIAKVTDNREPDDDWLSAGVQESETGWEAIFFFAQVGSSEIVTYSIGDWTETIASTDGTAVFYLPDEPTETGRLTIVSEEEGAVVGYQAAFIPPGEFAAG